MSTYSSLARMAFAVTLVGSPTPALAQANPHSSGDHPSEFIVGMLTVVDPADCPIPEGCGAKYKLWTSDMSACLALQGPICDEDGGRIIRARGFWASGVPGTPSFCGYESNPELFVVQSYAVRSRIEFPEFLREAKDGLAERVYGCWIPWDTSHLWRLDRGAPELILRLTALPGGAECSVCRVRVRWNDGEVPS